MSTTMWLMGASHKCLLVTIETNKEKRNAARISNEPPARASSSCQSQGEFALHSWLKRLHTHTRRSFTNVDREWMAVVRGGRDPFGRVTKGQSIKIHWPSISRSQWVEKKRMWRGPFITRTFHFVCLLNRRAIDFVSLYLFLPIRLKRTTTTTIFPHRFFFQWFT